MTARAEISIKVGRNYEAQGIRCGFMRPIRAKGACHIPWRIGIRDLNIRKCTAYNLLHLIYQDCRLRHSLYDYPAVLLSQQTTPPGRLASGARSASLYSGGCPEHLCVQ